MNDWGLNVCRIGRCSLWKMTSEIFNSTKLLNKKVHITAMYILKKKFELENHRNRFVKIFFTQTLLKVATAAVGSC